MSEQLHKLTEVLDTFGSDSMNWPGHCRDELLKFVSEDAAARQAYEEAVVLDDMLAMPPVPEASESLVAGIVAAVTADRENIATAQVVVLRQGNRYRDMLRQLTMASGLAASLLIGIFIGSNGVLDSTFDESLQIAQIIGTEDNAGEVDYLIGTTLVEDLL
jgi:hypothetical protein